MAGEGRNGRLGVQVPQAASVVTGSSSEKLSGGREGSAENGGGVSCSKKEQRVSSSTPRERGERPKLTIDTTTTPRDLPNLEHSLGLALDDKDILRTHDRRMLQEQVGVNRVVNGDARVGVG